MLRTRKLNKLKSIVKRLSSLSRSLPSADTRQSPNTLHPVYVGQSRRRYLITAELAEHPLLQVLLRRSGGGGGDAVVSCEVVLFEHLIWMLENGGGEDYECVDELVEYYEC